MNQQQLETKLADQLAKDCKKPSRCRPGPDDTTIVTPSGYALGLALRISQLTGEDEDDIMNRVMP